MAKRQSKPAPAFKHPPLDDLVRACFVFDDWLQWMAEACGSVTGNCVSSITPMFLNPFRFLPSVGTAFSEDGDDGTLAYAINYLTSEQPFIKNVIFKWAPFLTLIPTERPMSYTLLSWNDSAERLLNPGIKMFYGWPPGISTPTAHECVWEWFNLFVRFVAQFRDDNATSDQEGRVDLASAFMSLDWNQQNAAVLLAAMEQERRCLSKEIGLPKDAEEYYRIWRPNREHPPEAQELIPRLSPLARDILHAVYLKEGRTQKQLSLEVLRKATPSGQFKSMLSALIDHELVDSGGPGRASSGYRLTPLGSQVAELLKAMRSTSITPIDSQD
ncbi:MAG: hypothetical protein WCJ09_26605 [Planctomycetota bacterium]